ncbi:hypothetical protein F4780DRAFT_777645 [Xylariomycetidae sp. FL0641]|nr:hypothetical protein F4780DRAFT_777645 [Xylariomycetidae sp. FL0641]
MASLGRQLSKQKQNKFCISENHCPEFGCPPARRRLAWSFLAKAWEQWQHDANLRRARAEPAKRRRSESDVDDCRGRTLPAELQRQQQPWSKPRADTTALSPPRATRASRPASAPTAAPAPSPLSAAVAGPLVFAPYAPHEPAVARRLKFQTNGARSQKEPRFSCLGCLWSCCRALTPRILRDAGAVAYAALGLLLAGLCCGGTSVALEGNHEHCCCCCCPPSVVG